MYAFDDITVDPQRFAVARAGQPIALEPKAFDLLLLLLDSQGRVVTKQEILDRVWAGTAVTDNALTRIVAQLRKALGDDARESKYIETVPTRGYRWMAPVRTVDSVAVRAETASRRLRPAALIIVAALVVVAILTATLGWRRASRVDRAATTTLRAVQLTVSPGLDVFPTFSPDGRFVAFSSNRSGAFEISVRGLAGGADERDVTHDGGQNVQPAWSPDAALIAYHSRVRGGIWVVPALGGVARQISRFGSRPAWSPDSRTIAFQSDPCIDIAPYAYSANIPSTIWIAALDGNDARALTSADAPSGAHGSPVWSPDGRRIAFITSAAGALRLWTIPAAGGRAVRVEGIQGVLDAAFTPDGSAILATTGNAELLKMDIAADGTAIGSAAQILTTGIGSARHLAVASDGRRVAFSSLDLESHLWTLPMAGVRAAGPPVQLTAERANRQNEPAFSPDGLSLAFLSSRAGAGGEIMIVGPDGGRSTPVTLRELFSVSTTARPSWTADGRAVRYMTRSATSLRAVSTALDSRRETTLFELPMDARVETSPFAARDLSVSPDGTMAAYSQIDPATARPRLHVRQIPSGAVRAITDGTWSERYPVWSPDSRTIAFELKKDDATNVAVVAAAGGAPRLLTAAPGESWPYGWSPDGDKIVFAALREGLWNLWWVSVTSGEAQPLTTNASANTFVRYPTWSPKGDRIAYELGTVTGNIWIAQLPSAAGE